MKSLSWREPTEALNTLNKVISVFAAVAGPLAPRARVSEQELEGGAGPREQG